MPQRIGTSYNGGRSSLLGTTDSGSTWSQVSFTVPTGAAHYLSQSYLSIGSIDCPSDGVCVALGIEAQSAASVPTYSFVLGGSN